MRSSVEILDVATGATRVVYRTERLLEAPNWSPDGRSLVVNGDGRLYRLALADGAELDRIDTGTAVRCNNDHGLSPDGEMLAISDGTRGGVSRIFTLPATGGEPRQVTPLGPSYWHGWSPDGRTLAYAARRDGGWGIFTIPVEGGEERRVTATAGLDDGPDFTPDGRWIVFNGDRAGRMQIWRVHPDGGGLEQITDDDRCNWFPHPSPDGRLMVVLSYAGDVEGHPRDRDVELRLLRVDGDAVGAPETVVELLGGQGTINVPSWAPDSRAFAFVRYARGDACWSDGPGSPSR